MPRAPLSLLLLAVSIVFAVAGTPPSPEGSWRVTEIAGRATDASVNTTLELSGNGMAAGTAGCNHYRAQSMRNGNSLTFKITGATAMNCRGPQMKQEELFFVQLPNVRSWRLESGKLLLMDADNKVILRAER